MNNSETLKNSWSLVKGLANYSMSGKTNPDSYQALVQLFCATGGRSSDTLHNLVTKVRPKKALKTQRALNSAVYQNHTIAKAGKEMENDGLYIVENAVTTEDIADLKNHALTVPAKVQPARPGVPEYLTFDPEKPQGEIYRFDMVKLMSCHAAQKLVTDEFILNVAQEYLGCEPVNSSVTMWWSTAEKYSEDAARANAQMYHFDMDRIKWLKVFFYLTEVKQGNGEHVFVLGSHRTGNQPDELLKRGYARIPDHDVNRFYGKDKVRSILGTPGTMFFEDTRGFHKGEPLTQGNRLVFELEFADSLFGGAPTEVTINEKDHPILVEAKKKYPRVYGRFHLA